MNILGVDYGRKKVGLAIALGPLSEPLGVIRYKNMDTLNDQLRQIIKKEKVDKVVVGTSEGAMGEESGSFALSLESEISIPVVTFDETLTSKDAQSLSMQAGIAQKKRQRMEDAYAASIMLQNYLDEKT